jgi:GH15 family glucan-1,4-alpha-glucosidase
MDSKSNQIGDHGVIGDLHTVALVGTDGAIDWCCFPHFDSPSIFGALLDAEKGGRFKIAPTEDGTSRQMYLPETNVLLTRFLHADGVGELTDFMPVECDEPERHPRRHRIIRIVSAARGKIRFKLECAPGFNYGRDSHEAEFHKLGVIFRSSGMAVGLVSSIPLTVSQGVASAEFTVEAGQTVTFILQQFDVGEEGDLLTLPESGEASLRHTVAFWRRWIGQCRYSGRWREMVQRSALALKLLTYAPTGAIVAAPTTSLPEHIGGVRNWDYRYTWIRDAAFSLYGLLRLGFTKEAGRFMDWLNARCHELNQDGSLQPVYRIDGSHDIREQELAHLAGYRDSRPVRIGNEAATQVQLDIYGALMDAVYLFNKYGSPISYDLWINLARLLDYVCAHWDQPDDGIWEVRGGRQQFVYSKVMCWVALDRGLRIADKRGFPADRGKWLAARDQIYRVVMERGWNRSIGAFVQYEGSEALDASALIMPLVFFLSPTDPRMISTLDRIMERLVSDSLVRRYQLEKAAADGLSGDEGTFNLCTFWLVEALTRAGRLEQARLMFEKMLSYANHVGLYAEELSHTGEHLGNFPQAFTHIGLISAAYNLDRALSRRSE